ncbi:AER048Cp [Eremothecium gossypii ATCC 10895]|uniref:SWR1-complex protein 7 n=1 Tax=Eremothecium gossypii (strain ATCC 10895 / CBS 109.51 / FGSC 9923 / NRRL Y-1056) TaxID=284811 RepID=SWC7_EREGS|nr:AER048Cp [Eremothecium gossypii ATCC 10895]Q757G5.1 RecName: Full=SWR1-complex protein 7 [Eremothecium gossypii ATCC 10895]AAS52732.1 AER048Cp [Eremothecium gossypii ATCC 10895]AEY97038.1 FAER048Cp [Eremothecium gossypii FDAG1]
MEYKYNVTLLLLQVVLHRQQELAHQDKTLSQISLLREPVVDTAVLERFSAHRVVRLYAPELCGLRLEELQAVVREVFARGLAGSAEDTPVTLITLANHYYRLRVQELELQELPKLKELMESAAGLRT